MSPHTLSHNTQMRNKGAGAPLAERNGNSKQRHHQGQITGLYHWFLTIQPMTNHQQLNQHCINLSLSLSLSLSLCITTFRGNHHTTGITKHRPKHSKRQGITTHTGITNS